MWLDENLCMIHVHCCKKSMHSLYDVQIIDENKDTIFELYQVFVNIALFILNSISHWEVYNFDKYAPQKSAFTA